MHVVVLAYMHTYLYVELCIFKILTYISEHKISYHISVSDGTLGTPYKIIDKIHVMKETPTYKSNCLSIYYMYLFTVRYSKILDWQNIILRLHSNRLFDFVKYVS